MTTQNRANDIDPKMLNAVKWRCIGPPRGGRVVAVAGDPSDPGTFYFGACAGGVWKTEDGGTYWENVSDGYFNTASVGAIAVSDSEPSVVYAGMGEACIRLDVTHGDGVYRSNDGGHSWVHLGLEDTRHISRVRIHPTNPDIVFVAALGHAFGPNEQRGIFRSTDGGKNWENVLYKSENAGVGDLSIDPSNPNLLFAGIWQVRRNFWNLTSGGPDSGLWRSRDGGDSWEDVSSNPGLPDLPFGRIGVAISPAKAGRIYATVEAGEPGVYRSDDYGDTWELVSDNRDLQGRPWYYQHIFADPQDADTAWVLNYGAWKSVDGGRTWTEVNTPHGDNHDLWIDPRNPRRMIEGNDGGACVSYNGGETFSTIYNQLTSQFYHLTTDTQFPYRVYGTQQDNSAISVPSRSHKGAIPWGDCYTTGSSESGYIVVDPTNPNIVISGAIGSSPGGGGNMLRYDHSTGQVRIITVWPEMNTEFGPVDARYRFQWTYPIQFSPHDPGVLYAAGNVVFKSTDQGESWGPISPDLTRNDPEKLQPSGGDITGDASGAETYCTVFSFLESPHEKGVFWAGSDDGLVHISRDGGANWANITPPDLEEWTRVDMIEVSPHDPATAYLSGTRYKFDDNRPFLFKTSDYGATWQSITGNLPADDFTRCIREDTERQGLLYVGTETGIYVSFDDGGTWHSLRGNLPVVPVYDLAIKDDDLVAATHGRSFWIMDGISQLRQVSGDFAGEKIHLVKPSTKIRLAAPFRGRNGSPAKSYQLALGAAVAFIDTKGEYGEAKRKMLDAGENEPAGVRVWYWLKDEPEDEVTLTFLDADGDKIKSYSSKKADEDDDSGDPRIPAEAGMNLFDWDMRYPGAHTVPGDKTTEGVGRGPLAPPGSYQVRLTVGEQSQAQSFEMVKDPRVDATQEDFDAQFALMLQIRDKLSETHDNINKIRSTRSQVSEWARRAEGTAAQDAVSDAADGLKAKLDEIEGTLIQTEYKGARDRLHMPIRLNAKLAGLMPVVSVGDYRPPQQAYAVLDHFTELLDTQFTALESVLDEDLDEFQNLLAELEIPAIVPRAES
ncbi:MAG: glycosyl hydrolase [Chloroflexi bacterium]|nr:glycosyl hydrolase [Chloroflexota bacterium]